MAAAESASPLLPSQQVLFEHLADAVYLIDPDTSHILWGNRASWAMLGLAPEAVLQHSVLSLQKDVTGMPAWTDIAAVIRAHAMGYTFVGRHRHADGHEVPVEVCTTCFEAHGRDYFLSVARDISRRVAAEGLDASREDQLRFALNEAMDGLWDWDVASGAVFFSLQLKRMLGFGPDEMKPVVETWSQAVHPDDIERVMGALQTHMAGQSARYEADYRLRTRNGTYLWVHDRGKVCARDANGGAARVVGMVQDITAHKHMAEQLAHLAAHDPLTGLANRREGLAMVEAHVQRSTASEHLGFSVCLFDIDHFKEVNDSLGHAAGDAGLCEVAAAVTHAVRRTSDFVCRWGGEEFLIVLPGAAANAALRVAEQVRLAVAQRQMDGVPALTISLGTATFPQDGTSATALIAAADEALYRAKQAGRNRAERAS